MQMVVLLSDWASGVLGMAAAKSGSDWSQQRLDRACMQVRCSACTPPAQRHTCKRSIRVEVVLQALAVLLEKLPLKTAQDAHTMASGSLSEVRTGPVRSKSRKRAGDRADSGPSVRLGSQTSSTGT